MKNFSNFIKTGLSGCIIASAFVATPSNAAVNVQPVACSVNDISPTAIACEGFVFGNAINDASSETLLAKLGYFGSVKPGIEDAVAIDEIGTIDFNTLLYGLTIIGVHYGNGEGSPGNPFGNDTKGDGPDTAFYSFDAGTLGLDTFKLNYNASSTVRLYQTGVGAVPEPSTWMMMLLGFAGVGFSLRRKQPERRGQFA